MSKLEEFVTAFGKVERMPPKDFKNKIAVLTRILNDNPPVRKLFREAVKEEKDKEPEPAAGLSNLFQGMDG